jgi:hypothetical protein
VHSAYLELIAAPGSGLPANLRLPLAERPLHLGRGPDNDLVLADDTVSWHHASVWAERGAVRVRDRGSTNGTWIDDQRLDGEAALRSGQVLRLGHHVTLRLGSTVALVTPASPTWRLEVLDTGAAVAVPFEGLRVGTGVGVDLSVPLAGVRQFVVRPVREGAEIEQEDGPAWIAKAGAPFEVGGVHFRVLPGEGAPVPTVGEQSPTDRYRLRVSLAGPSTTAFLEDPARGVVHQVAAENRAVLLYLLVVRLLEHRAARLPAERQGWCTDDELGVGVWGREAARIQANNLNVLVHRLRRELEEAGFDTGFLEKKSRALRARLVHVSRE